MKLSFYLLMTIGLLTGGPFANAQTSFILSANYAVGANKSPLNTPYAVTAFTNTDGWVDLVSANYDDNTLTVLTNDGHGHYGSNAVYTVGIKPNSVAAADVNGDGFGDLICANYGGGTFTVLTNNGTRRFMVASSPSAGAYPLSVVATDVNNDGSPDLICSHYSGDFSVGGLTVLTNDGSGGFTLSSSPAVPASQSVTAVDVNGDGKVDLISVAFFNSILTVLTNNGSGGFGLASASGVGYTPASVAGADVNDDGKVDFISADYGGFNTLTVLTNAGTGNLGLNATYRNVGVAPVFVTAADFNGDGKMDLVCANQGSATMTVLTNNGSGSFVLATNLATGQRPNWIAAADFNGDGKVDLACANRASHSVAVFFNTSIFPTPQLAISSSGNNLIVSWPSSWTNWTLQQNLDLATTNWFTSVGISDDGTNKNLIILLPPGNLYFRLLHQ